MTSDLTAAGEQQWADFQTGLEAELPALKALDSVIVNAGQRYVQWQRGPDDICFDIVSNEHLTGSSILSPQEEEWLQRDGWAMPDPIGALGWSRTLTWPLTSEQTAELAQSVTRAIRQILAIGSPADLDIQRFNAA